MFTSAGYGLFWSSYFIGTDMLNKSSAVTETNIKIFDRAHVKCVSSHPYTDHAEENDYNTNSSLPLNSTSQLRFHSVACVTILLTDLF